jgi:uncharacterized protein HemX
LAKGLFLLQIAFLATSCANAETSEERQGYLIEAGVGVGLSFLPTALGLSAGVGLSVTGDESHFQKQARAEKQYKEEMERFRAERRKYIDTLIPDLAENLNHLQGWIEKELMPLIDIYQMNEIAFGENFSMDIKLNSIMGHIDHVRQKIESHLVQISPEDLSYTREKLKSAGASKELVDLVVR